MSLSVAKAPLDQIAQFYAIDCSEELRTRVFCLGRDREFADSPLEASGFEPLVPLTYDGDAFQNTYPASPGLQAPEVGPAQNGMRSDQPFERLLVMRRSGDIAICRRTGIAPV